MARRIESIGSGVFFVALFALLPRKLSDYDIWYHLAIGREIFHSAALPATEFLTYSTLGQPTDYHEWGYALLVYVTRHFTGEWGLAILNALLAAGTLLALYAAAASGPPKIAASSPADRPVRWLAILGVVAVAQFRWVYRPEMMLLLAVAIAILALERNRRGASLNALWVLPPLGCALSQFHPSALFLVILMVPYALEAAWVAAPRDRWKTAGQFVLIAALTLALATLNPYGWKQVWLPVQFALQQELLQGITEFLPALQTPYAAEFVIMFIVGLAAVALQRPFSIAHTLLFALFALLAFQHVRNLALLALVMLVPVTNFGVQITEKLLSARPRQIAASTLAVLGYATLLSLAVMRGEWGAGVAPGLFPIAAADALERTKPPGRLFNFYDTGGYLAWRADTRARVFIDGRHYENDATLHQHNAVFSAAPSWRDILMQYKVGAIVTPSTLRYSGELVPLVLALADHPEWSPIVAETGGLLFVLSALAKNPLPRSRVWEQVLNDAGAIYAEFPDQLEAVRSMSIAYHELGQISSALDALQFYVNKNPNRAESKALLDRWRTEHNTSR